MEIRIFVLSLVIFSLLLSSMAVANISVENNVYVENSRYLNHEPIWITGDAEFLSMAQSEGWPGDGSVDNPYMISGYWIDVPHPQVGESSYGIRIEHVSFSFGIENCVIRGGTTGLYLYNVSMVTVENTRILNFTDAGAYLTHLHNVKFIRTTLDNTQIVDEDISDFETGIAIIYGENITAEGCTIKSHGHSLYLKGDSNSFTRNLTMESDELSGVVSVRYNVNFTLQDSRSEDPTLILVENSWEINIVGNEMSSSAQSTPNLLELHSVSDIRIVGNVIYHGKSTGRTIYAQYCDNVTIDGNYFHGRTDVSAISFEPGLDFTVSNNIFEDIGTAVYTMGASRGLIFNNTMLNMSNTGVLMNNGNNISIESNTFLWNFYAVSLWNISYSEIVDNYIYATKYYGIELRYSSHDMVHNNALIYNNGAGDTYDPSRIQAYDDSGNSWYYGKGNYWHDWANNNDTNDQNPEDGIVDWPYKIDGAAGAQDLYPLKVNQLERAPLWPRNLRAGMEVVWVNLSWDAPLHNGTSDIIGYRIYKDGVEIGSVPGTQQWYHDGDVEFGEVHTYYVRAINYAGASNPSNEIKMPVTVRINSDAELSQFAVAQGLSGDGSASNPYILSYSMDSHGARDAIYIGNITAYFVIQNSHVHNSSVAGIELYNLSHGAVHGCVCYANFHGIYLRGVRDSVVEENLCYGNNYYGMLMVESENNMVRDNELRYNNIGMRLASSSHNTIVENSIFYNTNEGIVLYVGSDGNSITENSIYNNGEYGAYLYNSNGNRIWNNSFYNNHGSGEVYNGENVQGYDNGVNYWNTSAMGNYWADWTTPDDNGDGIVDEPYVLDGGAKDYYPLTEPQVPIPEMSFAVLVILVVAVVLGLRKKL